jgi:hypothetical protein
MKKELFIGYFEDPMSQYDSVVYGYKEAAVKAGADKIICVREVDPEHDQLFEAMVQEIEILRMYGNKDCTNQADERLAELRAGSREEQG